MKNWVVKLLLLLFIPSFVGILFTVILGFNPGGWLQIATYAFPPLLTLAGGAFIVASRWKVPFLILMAVASMAFNMPLQNWLFYSADEVVVSIRPRACFSPSYNKVKSQTKHVWLLTLL